MILIFKAKHLNMVMFILLKNLITRFLIVRILILKYWNIQKNALKVAHIVVVMLFLKQNSNGKLAQFAIKILNLVIFGSIGVLLALPLHFGWLWGLLIPGISLYIINTLIGVVFLFKPDLKDGKGEFLR